MPYDTDPFGWEPPQRNMKKLWTYAATLVILFVIYVWLKLYFK